MGPGINVIPLLPIPVGGIGSETLLRDMMDLDCWIVSTGVLLPENLRAHLQLSV